MKYLSADHVIEMHATLVERYGGEEGGGHRGSEYEGAEAAVQAVRNSYYETIEELAVAYAVYIVQGHVFMDGNKRTGCAAMYTFLVLNGSKLALPNDVKIMIELQKRAEEGERTDLLIRWIVSQFR
jgi:death on curing protein